MTLVSAAAPIIGWPGNCVTVGAAPAVATDVTIQSGVSMAWVGVAREAMAISHIGFRAGTVTSSGTVSVSVQAISTAGALDGLYAANTQKAAQSVTQNTWNVYALDATANVPAGGMFGLLVEYGGSGTSFALQRLSQYSNSIYNLPYEISSGTPGRVVGAKLIVAGSSSTTYYCLPNSLAANSAATNTYQTGSGTNKSVGLHFVIPFKCRVLGARWWGNTTNGNFNLVIRDASQNSLSSQAYDGDWSAKNAGGVSALYLSTPVTLTAGGTYSATLESTEAVNFSMSEVTLDAATSRSAWPGGTGIQVIRQAISDSSWATTSTVIPIMDIIIDQIDDGAATGARIIGG